MKRGEIYYIANHNTYGAEMRKARPGIIVSNDTLNQASGVVEVVYLTTQPKKDMATHACINTTGRESTALCEQVDTVSVELLGDFCGTCTVDEMLAVDRALCASLDLKRAAAGSEPTVAKVATATESRLLRELEMVKAERDRYAKMLDKLFGITLEG